MKMDNHQTARYVVKRAIECGYLIRPYKCESCGITAYTEAHHEDYSRPLCITWLCRSCHAKLNPNAFKYITPTLDDLVCTKDFFRQEHRECPVSSAPEPKKSSAPRRWKIESQEQCPIESDQVLSTSMPITDSPVITRIKERTALHERLKAVGWLSEE